MNAPNWNEVWCFHYCPLCFLWGENAMLYTCSFASLLFQLQRWVETWTAAVHSSPRSGYGARHNKTCRHGAPLRAPISVKVSVQRAIRVITDYWRCVRRACTWLTASHIFLHIPHYLISSVFTPRVHFYLSLSASFGKQEEQGSIAEATGFSLKWVEHNSLTLIWL